MYLFSELLQLEGDLLLLVLPHARDDHRLCSAEAVQEEGFEGSVWGCGGYVGVIDGSVWGYEGCICGCGGCGGRVDNHVGNISRHIGSFNGHVSVFNGGFNDHVGRPNGHATGSIGHAIRLER